MKMSMKILWQEIWREIKKVKAIYYFILQKVHKNKCTLTFLM
jgi:hypothetical protein